MEVLISVILSTFAICLASLALLANFGIIQFNKGKPDKYEKYRNNDGLLGRKKDG